MSTFPQPCDSTPLQKLQEIHESLTANETDINSILSHLVNAVNVDIIDNHVDIDAIAKRFAKHIRGIITANNRDLQSIADRLMDDIIHAMADVEVSTSALERQAGATTRQIGGMAEPPVTEQEPQGRVITQEQLDRQAEREQPQEPPGRVITQEQLDRRATPEIQIQGEGRHEINIHNHDGAGINAITIVINVAPCQTINSAQPPMTDAFSQSPQAGGEGAPFNPQMYGDTSGDEIEPFDVEDIGDELPDDTWPIVATPDI